MGGSVVFRADSLQQRLRVGDAVGGAHAGAFAGHAKVGVHLLDEFLEAGDDLGVLRRQWRFRDYFRSVTRFDTESVCSFDDLMPSLVEAASIPYFVVKKGY